MRQDTAERLPVFSNAISANKMRKITFGCLYSFLFLFGSALVTCLLRLLFPADADRDAALGFVAVGLVLMLISGLLCFLLKKICPARKTPCNVAFSVVNAVALGIAMTGWYIDRGFHNPFWMMTLISLCAVAYLFLLYLIMRLPPAERHPNLTAALLIVLSLAGYILLLIFTRTTYVSTFGFYMLVETGFFFALCLPSKERTDLLTELFTATYSVIAVALLMLILIGGEGDFDLGIDLGDILPEGKKKKSGQPPKK